MSCRWIKWDLELLKSLSGSKIRQSIYISFSRNFGKAALYAGLLCDRDLVVVMDADLQDPLLVCCLRWKCTRQNVNLDCVGTRRTSRERTLLSQFLCCFSFIASCKNQPSSSAVGCRDFRMMKVCSRCHFKLDQSPIVFKGALRLGEFQNLLFGLSNVRRQASRRQVGVLGNSFYSLEGLLIFSRFTMIIAFVAGLLSCFLSLLLTFLLWSGPSFLGNPTSGWTSDGCYSLSWRHSTLDHWDSRQVYQ